MAEFKRLGEGVYADLKDRFLIEKNGKEWIMTDKETGNKGVYERLSEAKDEVDMILGEYPAGLTFTSLEDIREKGFYIDEGYRDEEPITNVVAEKIALSGDSYNDVAILLGISKQRFSEMLKGPSSFTLEQALKLSKLLDCTVNDLFQLKDEAWVVPYPTKQHRVESYYINTLTLEIIRTREKYQKEMYYWMDGNPETTISAKEMRDKMADMKKNLSRTEYHKARLEMLKKWHPIYARLFKNIKSNIDRAVEEYENK